MNLSRTIKKGAYMNKKMLVVILMLACVLPVLAEDKEEKVDDRINKSATVFKEILGMPDGIPKDLLNRAYCVVIFPSVKKAAFVVGGSYGRGLITCRKGHDFSGSWSAPAMFALEAGSFGFQIGGQETDFVLLIMNDSGARSVMSSKVKLGGDASIAAGPVGRDAAAATDIVMKAEILSYSRAQGLVCGRVAGGFDAALRRRGQQSPVWTGIERQGNSAREQSAATARRHSVCWRSSGELRRNT
jgi:lipid-binding SYLF domain-containing protein